MQFKFKNTPEQKALIKAILDKDPVKSMQAKEAIAAFVGELAQKFINQTATVSLLYTDFPYDEDSTPSIPRDLWTNEKVGFLPVWSQVLPGGMPTSQVEGGDEIKFATYRLDSALAIPDRYIKRSDLNVVAKAINRLLQEILLRVERNGWAVVLKALAEARTLNGQYSNASNAYQHLIRTNTAGTFVVDDLSKLITRARRINAGWAGGTPAVNEGRGLTDCFGSPELMDQIRGFAYNPVNTNAGVLSGTSGAGYTSSTISLPDNVREGIYRSAGTDEIFGVSFHNLNEFGEGQMYNALFAAQAGSTQYKKADGTGAAAFANATDELVFAADLTQENALRPIATHAESGATFTLVSEATHAREQMQKWYGSCEEGRIVTRAQGFTGIII